MKRSFLIKQLKSLKSQVESLLEAEGDNVPVDLMAGVSAFVGAVKETTIQFSDDMGVNADVRGGAKVIYNVASAPDGAANFGDSLSYDWVKFKMGVRDAAEAVDKWASNSAVYTSLKGYAKRMQKGIDDTVTRLQKGSPDFWKNAGQWQKLAILVGMFGLILLVAYSLASNPGDAAKKIYDAFINSVKNVSSKVADAASKIEASVEGLKAAANVFIKAFVAPFEVMFETLKAAMTEDVAIVFGVTMVSFGAALGILYYRGRPEERKAKKS